MSKKREPVAVVIGDWFLDKKYSGSYMSRYLLVRHVQGGTAACRAWRYAGGAHWGIEESTHITVARLNSRAYTKTTEVPARIKELANANAQA